MASDSLVPPPSVSWAQRSSRVFLTFNVECENPKIQIEKNSVYFQGSCAPENRIHEVNIPLYSNVDPEKSVQVNKGRLIELVLAKENKDEPFWASLTSDKIKHHWLKVDFNKWQDEDESGEENVDDMNDMFSSKLGDFGDDKEDNSSAEEEDLPDLE